MVIIMYIVFEYVIISIYVKKIATTQNYAEKSNVYEPHSSTWILLFGQWAARKFLQFPQLLSVSFQIFMDKTIPKCELLYFVGYLQSMKHNSWFIFFIKSKPNLERFQVIIV